MKAYRSQMGFLEASSGLLFEPGHTVGALLEEDSPPFLFGILALLVLTIFAPIAFQLYQYGITTYNIEALSSLLLVFALTLVMFAIMESLLLIITGMRAPFFKVVACAVYAIAPLIVALWLVYLFNYLASGRLTLVTLLVTGASSIDDRFLRVLPLALLVVHLMVLVVFYHGIRALTQTHAITGFILTLLSLGPLYVAFMLALSVGEMVRPDTIRIFTQVLTSPQALTVFQ